MKEFNLELTRFELISLIQLFEKLSRTDIEEVVMWEITCMDNEDDDVDYPSIEEVGDVYHKLITHRNDKTPLKLTLREIDILCDLGDYYVDIEFMSEVCRNFYEENGFV